MSEDALKDLEKEVRKRKRIASEWASQLHDLVEDKLPAGYGDLMGIAQSTYEACKAWDDANQQWQAAQGAN